MSDTWPLSNDPRFKSPLQYSWTIMSPIIPNIHTRAFAVDTEHWYAAHMAFNVTRSNVTIVKNVTA